jgi:hypothetical protein
MKQITIAIALSLSSPAFADDLAKALEAPTEAQFLANAGPDWTKVDHGRYQTNDSSGKRIQVGFGQEAMIEDLAALKALADDQQIKLATAANTGEKARLRHSIAQTRQAIGAIENSASDHEKLSTYGSGSLAGCNNSIAITTEFELYPAMVSHGGVTVEAWGPPFVYGGGPAIGSVTLIANANGLINSVSRTMYPSYLGDYLSTNSQFFDWGCNLEATATIVPSCPTAGYRSVKWVTNCTAIGNNQAPTPVYSGLRKR